MAKKCDAALLKPYVRAASWVMAQMIIGRGDVGYESGVLFQLGEDKDEREAWFDAARRQEAAAGRIAVGVPHRLLEKWKGGGQACER